MREKWLPFERDSAAFLGFAPVFIFLNFRLAWSTAAASFSLIAEKQDMGNIFFPGPFLGKQIVSWRKGDVQKPKDLKLGRKRITVTQSNHRSALIGQPGGVLYHPMIMKKEGKQVRVSGWEVYAIRALLCVEDDSWHPYQKGWVHWKLLKSGAWNCLDSFKKSCLSSSKCKIGLEDIPRTNFLLSFQVYVPACVKMAWGPALKCQIVLNDVFHFGMLMFSGLTQRFDGVENQKTK